MSNEFSLKLVGADRVEGEYATLSVDVWTRRSTRVATTHVTQTDECGIVRRVPTSTRVPDSLVVRVQAPGIGEIAGCGAIPVHNVGRWVGEAVDGSLEMAGGIRAVVIAADHLPNDVVILGKGDETDTDTEWNMTIGRHASKGWATVTYSAPAIKLPTPDGGSMTFSPELYRGRSPKRDPQTWFLSVGATYAAPSKKDAVVHAGIDAVGI